MTRLVCSIIILLLVSILRPLPAGCDPISIVAVGDLLLGGSATPQLKKNGFSDPFSPTLVHLQQADIAMANLEAPLTTAKKPVTDKTYTFKVSPAAAKDIKKAGFDLLTLANNHIGDFGPKGVIETVETLEQEQLAYAGAGRNLAEARRASTIIVDGKKIAFLAYSNTFPKSFYAGKKKAGSAPGYMSRVATDIKKTRAEADYVVVSFHWGAEKMTAPKDYQKTLGHLAIDNGACVVIGHHPHVLQGAELYNGGVIYYSLGNFAFGSYSRNAVTGGMARVHLDNGKLEKAEILPLNVFNYEVHFRPRPLDRGPAFAFAREFNNLSEPLETRLVKQPDLFWGIAAQENRPEAVAEREELKLVGRQDGGREKNRTNL